MDGEVKNVEHYSSQVQLHKQKSYFMVVAVTVVLPLILNNLKKKMYRELYYSYRVTILII